MLVEKLLESDSITQEDLGKILKLSRKATKKNDTFTFFFNNSVMGRMLDLFLDNPDLPIFTPDFLSKSDISNKSFYENIKKLTSNNIIIEIEVGKKKFYKWNEKSSQAKHISKLRDILDSNNVRLSE